MPNGILDLLLKTENMSMLNDSPEITYFRNIFHRYTPFSTEFIEQPAFGESGTSDYIANLSKAGDLVHKMFIKLVLKPKIYTPPEPPIETWINDPIIYDTLSSSLPMSSDSPIISSFSNLIDILTIRPLLLGVISDTERFEIVPPVEELIELYGSVITYRSFVFLSFVSAVADLQSAYTNSGQVSREILEAYINHPIHKLVYLNNVASRINKGTLPTIIPEFTPFFFDSYFVQVGGNTLCRYSPFYYSFMTQYKDVFNSSEYTELMTPTITSSGEIILYIPLIFYFCDYNTMALPLCALRYHDVTVGATTSSLPFLYDNWEIANVNFIIQYIHLSDRERLKFTTSNLEYLIHQTQEQVSTIGNNMTDISQELIFTRPTIEILWSVIVYQDETGSFDPFFPDIITKCELTLNGESIGNIKESNFYRLIPPFEAHTRLNSEKGVYSYSFALDAEQYQPSGSLNISRVPFVFLNISLNPAIWNNNPYKVELRVCTKCYNVLRIANGFSDIAFS
jgi:hypothetical protein